MLLSSTEFPNYANEKELYLSEALWNAYHMISKTYCTVLSHRRLYRLQTANSTGDHSKRNLSRVFVITSELPGPVTELLVLTSADYTTSLV